MSNVHDGNIFKIVDENNSFQGTGFLLSQKYIITCHHCICNCEEIFAVYNNNKYSLEWDKIFSKPEKDVAIFRIKDIQIKPLEYMKESPPGSEVQIFGYSTNSLKNFPTGLPVESKLYTQTIDFTWQSENIKGQKPWNKKPELSLKVYRLEGKYEQGFSGAPVFYKINNKIVGMFTALEPSYGYVIPIEEIIESFDIINPSKPYQNKELPDEISLFISKPSQFNPLQEKIWDRLQQILSTNDIPIKFLDPNEYPDVEPINKVKRALNDCHGIIVLGLKQVYVEKGISKKGTNAESFIENYYIPTPWNNLEAGMAFMEGLPLLIIHEENISGGIFDVGSTDIIVHQYKIQSEDWWMQDKFKLILNEWIRDVLEFYKNKSDFEKFINTFYNMIQKSSHRIKKFRNNLYLDNVSNISKNNKGKNGSAINIGRKSNSDRRNRRRASANKKIRKRVVYKGRKASNRGVKSSRKNKK